MDVNGCGEQLFDNSSKVILILSEDWSMGNLVAKLMGHENHQYEVATTLEAVQSVEWSCLLRSPWLQFQEWNDETECIKLK